MVVDESWRSDLERWLKPFLAGLSHLARRVMCPLYIAGLIGPGDRKSVQSMAARTGEAGYDQLHHFVAAGIWDSAPLDAALLNEADRLVGGGDAFLVIDDTAMPKKGRHSVGVAPQYASSLGKNANCQTLVSVTLASREVPVMVSLRLFLPESWTSDPERMARAKVPEDRRAARTKPEIAIEEIDRIKAAGVRDVALIFPVAGHGKPRQHHVPDSKSIAAEKLLAEQQWRSLSWRRGTKGRLTARFAALRVRVADGPTQRIRDMGNQHLPGEEVWLVGEHRSTGERKYYLSNLPADTAIKKLAGAIKARWICEQAHQQLKEELGLDHFEGRSWIGLHRHALMTMIAYTFLQSRRLTAAGRKKRVSGPPPQPSMPAVRQAILNIFTRPPPTRCPHCHELLAVARTRKVPK